MGTTDPASSRSARAWQAPREGGPLPTDLERVLGAKLAALRVHTGWAVDAAARVHGAGAIGGAGGLLPAPTH